MIFKKKSEDQRDTVISYKNTFGTPQGKQVLFDLMNRFHVLNPHSGEGYAEGQRSVILHIMYQCNINITEFDKLLNGE